MRFSSTSTYEMFGCHNQRHQSEMYSPIVDMEKHNGDCATDTAGHASGFVHEALSVTGHRGADVTKTLEGLGMENMAVIGDQIFLFESKYGRGLDPSVMRWKRGSV